MALVPGVYPGHSVPEGSDLTVANTIQVTVKLINKINKIYTIS